MSYFYARQKYFVVVCVVDYDKQLLVRQRNCSKRQYVNMYLLVFLTITLYSITIKCIRAIPFLKNTAVL